MRAVAVVRKHRMLLISAAVVLIIAGTMLTMAMAQPAPQQGDDDGAGQRGGDMRGMMMRGMGTAPVMAVTDDAVFLFVRNTLFKFDADTLELLAQTQLPMPERPQPMPQ